MDLKALTQRYIEHAAAETDKKGQTRAPSTITSYRRALEGFVAAAENAGLTLETLPEDFLEKHWMATQQSVLHQPIQLRVRVGAVKQFKNWLWNSNIPCAPLRFPEVKTPPPKPKPPKETPMNIVNYPDDAMQADPVPSAQTYVPPPAPQVVAPVVPPPAPKQLTKQPQQPKNPLAAMLPSSQYKLRVRREREMDEPVWVGDYPADRVAAAGAVEPFLGREVAPRMVAQGITGDVTFLVSSVGPNGVESERNRLTVSCAPQVMAPVQSVAAPVAGAPVSAGGVQSAELADMLAYHRKAQEELEERLSKKLEAQPKAVVEEKKPVANDELNDLKAMVASLAGSVRDLSERLEEREYPRVERIDVAPAPVAPPAPPQLDILSVLREVMALNKQVAPPPAPVSQPMDMAGMFNVMAQAKQMFAPAQVNIDVSPLEEQLSDLRQQMAAQAKKKDEITETVEKFKALKELFGVVGGEGASKPTNGLSSALGNLVNRVLENPAPLAEAVERILGATAQMQAAKNGVPPPPRAAPQPPPIPPQMLQATKALLDAESPEATVLAAHEWLSMMTQVPALAGPAGKLTAMLREGKKTELTIYFRQIFSHLGFAQQADAARVTKMVKDILAQVQKTEEEDEEQDEEGDDTPADLTVRVGGVQPEEQDETQDETQDDEEDTDAEAADDGADNDDDDSEGQQQAEPEAEEPPEVGPDLPPINRRNFGAAPVEQVQQAAPVETVEPGEVEGLDASIDEVREVLLSSARNPAEEPGKKTRRKRRTKAEMEAARAAEALAEVEGDMEAVVD